MPLPKFGITEEVRVCDTCFAKGGKGVPASGPAPPVPVGRTPRSRRDFDADLQRAIELSLQDSQPSGSNFVGSEPPLVKSGRTAADDDEELRLAIEASLREMEARPSAPQGQDEPEYRVRLQLTRRLGADLRSHCQHLTWRHERQRRSSPSQTRWTRWLPTASGICGDFLRRTCCMSRRICSDQSCSATRRRSTLSSVRDLEQARQLS